MTMNPVSRYRPVIAVAFTAALLVYVGCTVEPDKDDAPNVAASSDSGKAPDAAKSSSAQPAPKPENTETAKAEIAKAPPEAPAAKEAPAKPAEATKAETKEARKEPEPTKDLPQAFLGWPPAVAGIVISGEQFGYLEPCGCTQGQLGGLLRRYNVIQWLSEEKKWPLVKVDLGSLIKNPGSALGGPDQAKEKFRVALKSLGTLGYTALALSPEDLKVGVDEAIGQFLNMQGDSPKIVAANVTVPGLESRLVKSARVKAGLLNVGITAVIDPEQIKALKDPSLDLLTIEPIDKALAPVLADLLKDTQTQILLVQGPPELARQLVDRFPGFDIVVSTSTPDPPREAESFRKGETLLVQVGQKGKYLGVVGVFGPQESKRYRYERITLDGAFDGPASPIRAIIEDEYRQTLKDQGVVANYPRRSFISAAPGATFAGALACKSCHPNTYDHWAGTGHSHAFRSLLKDPKPNTIYDAECVTCHTTGFEYSSGWKSPELTPLLKGNQCENCHGPASKHVEDPDNKEFLGPLHLTAAGADKNRLCLGCHDEDNSPKFKFETYYDKIDHAGLDDYTDPKVHKKGAK